MTVLFFGTREAAERQAVKGFAPWPHWSGFGWSAWVHIKEQS